jgi:hypothetical protein
MATYSITSSARDRNDSGIVSPSALAVFILITRSNLVGCSTERAVGLAPCNYVRLLGRTNWNEAPFLPSDDALITPP